MKIVWPALYQTPGELLEMVQIANSAYMGVYFDPANILQHIDEGNTHHASALPEDWLQQVGPFVKAVHMKDYTLGRGFDSLLDGDVNWWKIRQLLSDFGYDGWLVAEIEVEPHDHLDIIKKSSKAIDLFIDGRFPEK